MADIKTIAEEFTSSGSLCSKVSSSLESDEMIISSEEMTAIYILRKKIDELITEVNILKNK